MLILGGTDQTNVVEPESLDPTDSLYLFDLEACTWQKKIFKGRDSKDGKSEVMPWNLLNPSLFKLDSQNVGVLWFDLVTSDEAKMYDKESENIG